MHIQHRTSLAEVVAWAEHAILDADYKDDSSDPKRNIFAQPGTADKKFGLEWKDSESMMEKPGFKLKVKALEVAYYIFFAAPGISKSPPGIRQSHRRLLPPPTLHQQNQADRVFI